MRNLVRHIGDIAAKRLQVEVSSQRSSPPEVTKPLRYGTCHTDHMLDVDWAEGLGWSDPQIKPYQPLVLDPCASVFHYGTECFEGLKAYKSPLLSAFSTRVMFPYFAISLLYLI